MPNHSQQPIRGEVVGPAASPHGRAARLTSALAECGSALPVQTPMSSRLIWSVARWLNGGYRMGVQSRSTRVTDGLSRRGFLAASAAAGVAAAELGRLSDTESARAQGDAPTVLLDTVSATVITPDDAAFVYTGAHEARAAYPGFW